MARPVRRLRWLAAAFASLALIAGCANVPTSGLLQHTARPAGSGGGQQGSGCCGLIMRTPAPGWRPSQIVLNFLLAGASFGDSHGIARQYLTRAASRAWQPGPGPAVTVIAQPPRVTSPRWLFGSPDTAVVGISAQELGQVSASGQYIPAEGGRAELNQQFTLQRVNRQWRIATLPSGGTNQPSSELLLTKDLFQLAYQPRNLYYLDPAGKGKDLVPDPVFVPVDSADPAADLVRALLVSPQGWLGAVLSAFPPAAVLRRPVQILPGSKTAVVDLSLPKSATSQVSLAGMASQLVWTLTSSSHGSKAIQAVKLEVNDRVWTPPGAGSAVLSRRNYPQPALEPPRPESPYFLGSNGAVRVLGGRQGSRAVPGQAGTGQVPLTTIAVSPDQRYLAGIGGPAGAPVLYTTSLAAAARPHASTSARALQARMSNVPVTSVSWDRYDNLWAAGTSGGKPRVWMLGASGSKPLSVGVPSNIRSITALRVAPDGVRVAMIARVSTSAAAGPETEVLLGAVVRTTIDQVMISTAGQIGADLRQPSALSWYDADHLLVVNQVPSDPQLEVVPVDGDRSSYQGFEPDMASIAAAGPHNSLFAGLQTGHLARSLGLGELWTQFAEGRAVTYPG